MLFYADVYLEAVLSRSEEVKGGSVVVVGEGGGSVVAVVEGSGSMVAVVEGSGSVVEVV